MNLLKKWRDEYSRLGVFLLFLFFIVLSALSLLIAFAQDEGTLPRLLAGWPQVTSQIVLFPGSVLFWLVIYVAPSLSEGYTLFATLLAGALLWAFFVELLIFIVRMYREQPHGDGRN